MIRLNRDKDLHVRFHSSAANDRLLRKRTLNKQQELKEAVEWCQLNNCRGYKALTAVGEDGQPLFPQISDARTINKRLDGLIQTGEERRYCSLLTVHEEECLVRYLKNKNRACQSVTERQAS